MGNFSSAMFLIVCGFFVSACLPFNSSQANTTILLNYTDCLLDNATNITINIVPANLTISGNCSFNQSNASVYFNYADYGVPAKLNYTCNSGEIVFNAPKLSANITLSPGGYNNSFSSSVGVSAWCAASICTNQTVYLNNTITACPLAGGTIILGYAEEYANATYGLRVRAPSVCTNTTLVVNQSVLPVIGVDQRLDAGEVWSNTSLGLRFECLSSQGFKVEKQLAGGESYVKDKTYFEELNLTCTTNTITPTPMPSPSPSPSPTPYNSTIQTQVQSQNQQTGQNGSNDFLYSLLAGLGLAGVGAFVLHKKKEVIPQWQSTSQSPSQSQE